MDDLIKKTAKKLVLAKNVAALTGAGISVESNIPPFRGPGGIWEKIDPMQYAHIDAFIKDPVKVWDVLLKNMKEIIDLAKPNDAHLGLARLEKLGILKTIITQNVDQLHQKAGNTDVIEFHGNFAWQRCMKCNNRFETRKVDLTKLPPQCECGEIYRPECVFFGEMIPPDDIERSEQVALECDIMLVIGTSAVVQPAAHIPVLAKRSGATIIEINPERTPLTKNISDWIIIGQAGRIMNNIIAELEAFL